VCALEFDYVLRDEGLTMSVDSECEGVDSPCYCSSGSYGDSGGPCLHRYFNWINPLIICCSSHCRFLKKKLLLCLNNH
jgi:hypothetical protein